MLIWMSFVDRDRPEGQRNLGVCIVEIDELDLDAARDEIAVRFPHARPGAEVVAAASKKAWDMACNPGGEVMSCEIDPAKLPPDVPLHRLMQAAELHERGLA